MDTINLQIPSLSENIRIVESFIDNIKEQYHINEDIYGNVLVAVTEAVANAIFHGNASNPDKNVALSVTFLEEAVSFIVRDEGNGFDYHQTPDPVSPENLDKIGGRGIFLIKHLADEVHFREEGREIEMIFYMK
ncbi:MAG: ATP-binding protein [Thermonemataceae bacterium]|nr:ATP-binding protein [Thermonemataceae bacterium]